MSDSSEFPALFARMTRTTIHQLVASGWMVNELRRVHETLSGAFDVSLIVPEPGYLNVEDPTSGICRLIRTAVAAGFLDGTEDFLDRVCWQEPE